MPPNQSWAWTSFVRSLLIALLAGASLGFLVYGGSLWWLAVPITIWLAVWVYLLARNPEYFYRRCAQLCLFFVLGRTSIAWGIRVRVDGDMEIFPGLQELSVWLENSDPYLFPSASLLTVFFALLDFYKYKTNPQLEPEVPDPPSTTPIDDDDLRATVARIAYSSPYGLDVPKHRVADTASRVRNMSDKDHETRYLFRPKRNELKNAGIGPRLLGCIQRFTTTSTVLFLAALCLALALVSFVPDFLTGTFARRLHDPRQFLVYWKDGFIAYAILALPPFLLASILLTGSRMSGQYRELDNRIAPADATLLRYAYQSILEATPFLAMFLVFYVVVERLGMVSLTTPFNLAIAFLLCLLGGLGQRLRLMLMVVGDVAATWILLAVAIVAIAASFFASINYAVGREFVRYDVSLIMCFTVAIYLLLASGLSLATLPRKVPAKQENSNVSA